MFRLDMSKINELFSLMNNKQELYLPVKVKKDVIFGKYDESTKNNVRLDVLNTVRSPKDLFFPHTENLVGFKTDGKNISVIDTRKKSSPFVIFGVRACDVRSFDVLDRVFLSEPVDTYYADKRNNSTVVSMACSEPETTCFCKIFGIDAAEGAGDVSCWISDNILYWNANTEKGEKLTEAVKSIMTECDSCDDKTLREYKEKVREIIDRLPLSCSTLSLDGFDGDHLNEKFNSLKWAELSQACLSCGTCTFICPTCQCYDIRDYDTGHGIQRYRCWDSCMCSDFTKMAHGNPRTSTLERFRQRYMHKLIYFPANNDGMYSCVGCGRCLAKCPISMNIVKVMKALGGRQK